MVGLYSGLAVERDMSLEVKGEKEMKRLFDVARLFS